MDFSKKTLVELREIAKEKGLKGITALRKPELIQRLMEVSEETKREPEVMPERTMERKPVSQRAPMERQTRPVRQDRMERNDRQDRYERRPMRRNENGYGNGGYSNNYNGGGHMRAAGCDLQGSVYDVINNVTEQICKQFQEQEV